MIILRFLYRKSISLSVRACRLVGLLERQVKSAHRASIVRLKPWFEAVRMVDVSAGHEHSFCLQLYVITTDCTAWGLQRVAFLFTVFLLNFDDW